METSGMQLPYAKVILTILVLFESIEFKYYVSSRVPCSLVCAYSGNMELSCNEDTKAVQDVSEDEDDI